MIILEFNYKNDEERILLVPVIFEGLNNRVSLDTRAEISPSFSHVMCCMI